MADEDRYPNMAALFAATVAGRDFRIHRRSTDSGVAIVAPHGGAIEPGTFELADAIAGASHNFYCFEAIADGLHVTSTNFDDPACLSIVERCDHVLTVHGCKDKDGVVDLSIATGGRDVDFGAIVCEQLEAQGFAAGDRPEMAGVSPRNICNRGRRGMGVQLEITRSLRDKLMETRSAGAESLFAKFTTAVSRAIQTRNR